jgi:hypothetical protein
VAAIHVPHSRKFVRERPMAYRDRRHSRVFFYIAFDLLAFAFDLLAFAFDLLAKAT